MNKTELIAYIESKVGTGKNLSGPDCNTIMKEIIGLPAEITNVDGGIIDVGTVTPDKTTGLVAYDRAQSLTTAQKTQAQANIGVADSTFSRYILTRNSSYVASTHSTYYPTVSRVGRVCVLDGVFTFGSLATQSSNMLIFSWTDSTYLTLPYYTTSFQISRGTGETVQRMLICIVTSSGTTGQVYVLGNGVNFNDNLNGAGGKLHGMNMTYIGRAA